MVMRPPAANALGVACTSCVCQFCVSTCLCMAAGSSATTREAATVIAPDGVAESRTAIRSFDAVSGWLNCTRPRLITKQRPPHASAELGRGDPEYGGMLRDSKNVRLSARCTSSLAVSPHHSTRPAEHRARGHCCGPSSGDESVFTSERSSFLTGRGRLG
jgi:hypothetical protein